MKAKTSNKIRKAFPRMPASPLSRLKVHLDVYQFTAADEILTAFRMANGLPVSRDVDLDIPLPCRFDDADEHAARKSDLVRVYAQWRHDLAGTRALAILEAVLFVETSLASLDGSNRWRKGTAREHLGVGLKHFAALRGNVPRGVRDWKYRR